LPKGKFSRSTLEGAKKIAHLLSLLEPLQLNLAGGDLGPHLANSGKPSRLQVGKDGSKWRWSCYEVEDSRVYKL
jgi:hypothetical protein